jgi:hypothetical protein
MNIDDLTVKQIREIQTLNMLQNQNIDGFMIGKKVIIRTYSAGVWYGELAQKSGNEVIIKDGRRMWQWFAAESISLSGCANYGINQSKSKIAPAVSQVWLEAIEILPCTDAAVKSLDGAENAKAS